MLIYKEIIKRDKNNAFAKTNIQQLEIHELEEKAALLFEKQNYAEAKKIYQQILTIDKNNESAKINLAKINDEIALWGK
ncbi:hypothetical protein D3C72_1942890 [compost metagenome]